jgi:hypothetical protein
MSVKHGVITEGRIDQSGTLSNLSFSTENRLHQIRNWEDILLKSCETIPKAQLVNIVKKLEHFFPQCNQARD